jgi:hypothetical protein
MRRALAVCAQVAERRCAVGPPKVHGCRLEALAGELGFDLDQRIN